MMWVGGSSTAVDQSDSSVWFPGDSVAKVGGAKDSIKFDLIIQNVKELNMLAGEGSSGVHNTPTGARLKVIDNPPH